MLHIATHQVQGCKVSLEGLLEPLHHVNEDCVDECESIFRHRIMLMADGHAGHEASHWFVSKLKQSLLQLFNEQDWVISSEEAQNILALRAEEIFDRIDQEFIQMKLTMFNEWNVIGCPPEQKPVDDGCTMAVNVIRDGFIMNMNVGDSRTVVATISCTDELPRVLFASKDHNMMEKYKIWDIVQRGGQFLNPLKYSLLNVNILHPSVKEGEYQELQYCRLFRPRCSRVESVGCSLRRTLNLTGTMGDLLFKIEPAILTPRPDISFIKLNQDSDSIMIMATDGLWDHLNSTTASDQISQILKYISANLSTFGDDNSSLPSLEETSSVASLNNNIPDLPRTMEKIARSLTLRLNNPDLFVADLERYDDISVSLAYISSECLIERQDSK